MWTRSYSARENQSVTKRGQVIRSRPGKQTTQWTREKINEALALARHNGWIQLEPAFELLGNGTFGSEVSWVLQVSSTGVQGTAVMWDPSHFTSISWTLGNSEEVFVDISNTEMMATFVAATTDWIGVGAWQREQRADELNFFLPYRDPDQRTRDLVVKWNDLSRYSSEGVIWRVQGDSKSGSTLISRTVLDLGYITAASMEETNNIHMFWFEKKHVLGNALSRYFNM